FEVARELGEAQEERICPLHPGEPYAGKLRKALEALRPCGLCQLPSLEFDQGPAPNPPLPGSDDTGRKSLKRQYGILLRCQEDVSAEEWIWEIAQVVKQHRRELKGRHPAKALDCIEHALKEGFKRV